MTVPTDGTEQFHDFNEPVHEYRAEFETAVDRYTQAVAYRDRVRLYSDFCDEFTVYLHIFREAAQEVRDTKAEVERTSLQLRREINRQIRDQRAFDAQRRKR